MLIFFKLTIILLMFSFGIMFIKGALHYRKEFYYPKAAWMIALADGIIFIIWSIIMIILEFVL